MVRLWLKLGLTCCLAWAAVPSAYALGLGEITVESALNERFDAQIEVLDASGLSPNEILVSLASAEDFRRVGVERFFFLTNLRFEVAYNDQGNAVINVTSVQPITEPYLNFLVEALWPSGRLLREYTVLLDPPTFGQGGGAPVAAPRAEPAPPPVAERPAAAPAPRASSGDQVRLAPSPPAPAPRRTLPAGDREAPMTTREDTLWKIAERTLPSQRVTVQQNMLAIQRLNPNAFIRNNINLIKAGYVLRLPTESDALAMDQNAAVAEVALQTDEWRSGSTREQVARAPAPAPATTDSSELRGQIDATEAPGAGAAAPAPTTPEGQLSIVAGADGEGVSAGTELGGTELAALQEEKDRLSREVDELTYQLDRKDELSGNQIAVKDRQLEVKDQQIAQLQEQLATFREEMKALEEGRATSQNQNERAAAPPEPWWMSPIVWSLAAVVLVLAAVLVMVLMRQRRDRQAELEAFLDEAPPVITPDVNEPLVAAAATELPDELPDEPFVEDDVLQLDEDEDLPEALASVSEIEAPDEDIPEELSAETAAALTDDSQPETGDVLAEADIYIAYERYPQATSLLTTALEEAPARDDVRLKLLEVYSETGEQEAFEREHAQLKERSDDDEILSAAEELAQRLQDAAPIHLDQLGNDDAGGAPESVATGELDVSPDLEASEEGTVDDFELSLDDLEDDADAADALEFELELDDDTAEEPPAVSVAPALRLVEGTLADTEKADSESIGDGTVGLPGDQLGGDLGIDFDPDKTPAGPGASADDDADLDLDAAAESSDEFDFLDDADAATTKLDLARAYIDMGDSDGARDILNEVLGEGSDEQQKQAEALLQQIA